MKSKKPSCFSTKIDPSLAGKLKNDLEGQGFKLCQPPYTLFSALKKGVSVTLYESGSLTVQGKDKDEFIEFYLEPEILKDFTYTNPTANLDLTPRIGVDEAGKGDFFGPLCVVSLYADKKGIEKLIELGVKDSKRFSDKAVSRLAGEIKKHCRHYILKLHPEKYNELYAKFKNLNRMLAWMHVTAIQNLHEKVAADKIIIDQFANKSVVEDMLKQKNLDLVIDQRVRGEEDVVVAAASILARKTFIDEMDKLSEVISFPLPKGASNLVIEAGKKIISKYDTEMLDRLSKSHFKTRSIILNFLVG